MGKKEETDAIEKINVSSFKTCKLVEELKKREGVEVITAEPYATKQITVYGPAIILKVTD